MKQLDNKYWVPDNFTGMRFLDILFNNGLVFRDSDLISLAVDRCKEKCTAIDGGAYIGTWSLHLAQHFEQVIAFEPLRSNYECLCNNVNGPHSERSKAYVITFNGALSDKSGNVWFDDVAGREFSAEILSKKKKDNAIEVTATAIDDLELRNLDLIKLDIEGSEYEALMGAMNTIERCKPVIVVEEKKDEEQRATKLLKELGMKLLYRTKKDFLFVW